MSEERQRTRSAATTVMTIVSFAVGLPLLYFLSVGPMVRIYYGTIPPTAVIRFYEPLRWFHANLPASGELIRLMDWYVHLWEPKPLPPSNVPAPSP